MKRRKQENKCLKKGHGQDDLEDLDASVFNHQHGLKNKDRVFFILILLFSLTSACVYHLPFAPCSSFFMSQCSPSSTISRYESIVEEMPVRSLLCCCCFLAIVDNNFLFSCCKRCILDVTHLSLSDGYQSKARMRQDDSDRVKK